MFCIFDDNLLFVVYGFQTKWSSSLRGSWRQGLHLIILWSWPPTIVNILSCPWYDQSKSRAWLSKGNVHLIPNESTLHSRCTLTISCPRRYSQSPVYVCACVHLMRTLHTNSHGAHALLYYMQLPHTYTCTHTCHSYINKCYTIVAIQMLSQRTIQSYRDWKEARGV